MKKTILYLRTDIYDHELIAGGSVTHTLSVIQGFLLAGYDIFCASSCMLETLKQIDDLKNFKELKNPQFLSFLRRKLNSILSNVFFTIQIIRWIESNKINFIYQRYSILNCTGVLLSKIKKIPLILEYNGSEVWKDKYWAKKKFLKLSYFINFIEIINIRNAHHIVVVSHPLKQELINRGINPNRILVNPNGVDTNEYDPQKNQAARAQIRQELNIENKFVFGFIGTFNHWHGINVLEIIIPQIIQQQSLAHFILIGDGPLCASLKKALKQKKVLADVTFTGILPQEKARKYLAACDAFLSPTQPNEDGSPFFGSPTKLFEYMSFAKPIIASDIGQIADIIKPAIRINEINDEEKYVQAYGFLIQPKNEVDFVKAACKLINLDKNISKKIGSNARNRTINEYSWEKHVSKILYKINNV